MKSRQKGVLGLALTLVIAPFFLRRRMRVFRRIFIAAPPETVFAYLHDLRNWPLWRSWSRRAESPHFSYAGPASGVGATQEFETTKCRGTLRIVKAERDDHLAYTIDFGESGTRCEGIFALREVRRGTWVRWIVKWEGHSQPPLRYADLWRMFRHGRRMTADLAALARLSESVLPPGGNGSRRNAGESGL